MMSEERQLVMQAVLEGKLPSHAVTLEELQEVEEILFELIADRSTPFQTWSTLQ
jgi:hypothetical protein